MSDVNISRASHLSLPPARAASERVAQLIEREIVEGNLPEGHLLGRRQELLDRYAVAAATLSEALRLLRARGVVLAKPGKGGGVFVSRQTPIDRLAASFLDGRVGPVTARDCIDVIDALDGAITRDAAMHRTDEDVAALWSLYTALERDWDDPEANQRANWALHRRIASISPNPVLRTVYENLVDFLTSDLGGVSRVDPERLQVHRELVEAVASGSQAQVQVAVQRHSTVTSSSR